jgi:hypothetical protein
MLVHGSNLKQKEKHLAKYRDALSLQYLAEIRVEYDKWSIANTNLFGPVAVSATTDLQVIEERVKLLSDYKDFIDQQKYAENFDSRSNLHSSVLEEFMYYLFRDLVASFGKTTLIGKSQTFKDIFFASPNYAEMLKRPYARIERKDHDFTIGTKIGATFRSTTPDTDEPEEVIEEVKGAKKGNNIETHTFDIPAVVIECKTYLDKTMLEGSSRAAEELKARNPNAVYIVVMEWIKLTEQVNLRKFKVDQIYILRRQKNTDREFRYLPNYIKNPIDSSVVNHLYNFVRSHLTTDWQTSLEAGLNKGFLL